MFLLMKSYIYDANTDLHSEPAKFELLFSFRESAPQVA